MHSLQYVVLNLHYRMYSIQIAVLSVQHFLCSNQCAAFIDIKLHYCMYSIQHAVLGVQHSLCSNQCTVFSVQYEVFSIECTVFIVNYIILNNGILKSNSTIFPQSKGYITQYTS